MRAQRFRQFFREFNKNNPAEIIVDGGSKDGTVETAKKYTKSVCVTTLV